ncbi:hypothetical protein C8J57DRAFT_1529145 [Mycena rebaudengoi]|nr:hypothetical protein C8J57DRAFT_1529145 [Mycena rebaudengoi]
MPATVLFENNSPIEVVTSIPTLAAEEIKEYSDIKYKSVESMTAEDSQEDKDIRVSASGASMPEGAENEAVDNAPEGEDTIEVNPLHELTFIFTYTEDEAVANEWLKHINVGRVGLDVEASTCTPSPEESYEHEINWDAIGICTVQVAYGDRVLVMNFKRMKGKLAFRSLITFPDQLKRILRSDRIEKGVVGPKTDANHFFEDFGVNIYCLVDVGLMVKFCEPEKHADFKGGELSLLTCVESLFDAICSDAALDAQASLQVFEEAAYRLREKELFMAHIIANDWYTLNCVDGVAT